MDFQRVLPHDKDYHIFVCYQSSNVQVVEKLVADLEAKGLVCCYYERDFTIGSSLMRSMCDAIRKSVNMLIVLSESFEGSDYCLEEVDQALNLRSRGQYNLIPIKIEPCSVPQFLQHLTHIDAENDLDSACDKIIDALAKRDIQKAVQDVKNGKWEKFNVQPYNEGRFKITRYKLTFSETDKTDLWEKEFQVTADALEEIEKVFNNSLLVKYLHVWEHVQFTLSVIFFLALTVFLTVFLCVLLASGREQTKGMQPAGYLLAIGLPVIFLIWGVSACVIWCRKDSFKGIYHSYVTAYWMLRDKIWDLCENTCEQSGIIFYLHGFDIDDPLDAGITFMKYNLKPCKEFFCKRIDDGFQEWRLGYETTEETTRRLFGEYLKSHSQMLESPSANGRHKMANKAKCVCLLAEEYFKSNQPQRKSTYNSKTKKLD